MQQSPGFDNILNELPLTILDRTEHITDQCTPEVIEAQTFDNE